MRTVRRLALVTLIGAAVACSSSEVPRDSASTAAGQTVPESASASPPASPVAPTQPTPPETTSPESMPPVSPSPTPVSSTPTLDVQQTKWAVHLSGPTNEDEVDGIAAAPDGSLYVTGKFEQTATLGDSELVSAGRADIPLAHFAADGRPLWVLRFGGPGEDNFFDIDADESGAVATGIFEGTVQFGDHTLVSAGSVDCAIVAVDPDGGVRWARSFGGPGVDGCNEVTIAPDGSIVTSIDTEGGWELPTVPIADTALGDVGQRDTVLVRVDPDGELIWGRSVGGAGPQRGKSLAVAPDGSVAFGGESLGDVDIAGEIYAVPGFGFDSWISRWSPDGDLDWVVTWGAAGRDFVKGLVHDDDAVYAVGPFDGQIDVQGTPLDAGGTTDLVVARFDLDGRLDWATSVQADGPLTGAEATSAPDDGLLFGSTRPAGLVIRDGDGNEVALDDSNGGQAWLANYRADGSVGWARTIGGAVTASPDEIARVGQRVYHDMTVRDDANSAGSVVVAAERKDSAVFAIDLPPN